jgi:DNA-binding NtrC family response regulator
VDDDPSVIASIGLLLKQHGYPHDGAAEPGEALTRLGAGRYDLVLQDMNFTRDTSGREGLVLLRETRRRWPELPVILVTAWGSIELAVEGMRAGAADFVTKPWSNEALLYRVRTALELVASSRDAAAAGREAPERADLDRRFDLGGLVGRDPRLMRVIELACRVAATDASVLITGESGTGKELVAAAIHRNSRRRAGPFVKVNLGGISAALFESEMFGHRRGAFTDAREHREGRFAVAHTGTIFLDEIGELEPASQVKLLRVLQDRTFEPLGSSAPRTVDVRVVSATNRDLGEAVARGAFREDLLYRLNLIALHLPPLRERRGDVALLARHFLAAIAEQYGRAPLTLGGPALAWLERHDWPGNVRQLRQTLERAVLVVEGERIELPELEGLRELETRPEAGDELPAAGRMTLDQLERAMIAKSLRHYGGNLTRVSEALGLSRAALYRRLRKYDLDPQRP